ncbi:MAG: FkbM family methyltransferase [Opitutaceae bacterium]
MSIQHQLSVSPTLLKLARSLAPIRCIYDCGSRDALDGLHLLSELKAEQLHAFECNPAAIALCEENIRRSPHAAKAQLVPVAIADQPGWLKFHAIDPKATVTPHADGNIGASSLYRANPAYPHEQYVQKAIEVQAVTLDQYSENHTPPDLLWMDLQGAEARALDGARSVLPQVKIIHVEVSFRRMYLEQALFHEIHQRLEKHFKLVHLDLGRWPRLPWLYRLGNFGPWVGNAIYVNRTCLPR